MPKTKDKGNGKDQAEVTVKKKGSSKQTEVPDAFPKHNELDELGRRLDKSSRGISDAKELDAKVREEIAEYMVPREMTIYKTPWGDDIGCTPRTARVSLKRGA